MYAYTHRYTGGKWRCYPPQKVGWWLRLMCVSTYGKGTAELCGRAVWLFEFETEADCAVGGSNCDEVKQVFSHKGCRRGREHIRVLTQEQLRGDVAKLRYLQIANYPVAVHRRRSARYRRTARGFNIGKSFEESNDRKGFASENFGSGSVPTPSS